MLVKEPRISRSWAAFWVNPCRRAVARDCGCTVAYLPGLAMRKAADLYPGRSKTDARDVLIIAETARAMPHTLRAVDRDSEVLAALKVLSGFDADGQAL